MRRSNQMERVLKRRRRPVEEEEEEEEDSNNGHYCKQRRHSARAFFDEEALEVDSEDEDKDDQYPAEDGFIVPAEDDLGQEDEDGRGSHRPFRTVLEEDDEEDLEEIARRFEARSYGVDDHDDEGIADHVDQQALLPSVRDPKLWMVKCEISHEREVAACLMQKCIDKGMQLQIRSVIALDHLKGYIYVEAEREAHVKEACNGMRLINSKTIKFVPIKEMTSVLSVESKIIDVYKDKWVRMKNGTYKGDLGRVTDVDNLRKKVTVKIVPRIDLKALADKLDGREVVKKACSPPPRLMDTNEARRKNIRVERRRHPITGEYFDYIGGMMFRDGFLYKLVSMRSILAHNIEPTLDEFENFKINGENHFSSSMSFESRKKVHFVKGDKVRVLKGDLQNLSGAVEKLEGENVLVRPDMKDLPRTIFVNVNELCKYFKHGDRVKVVSGVLKDSTGMVTEIAGHVLGIVCDTTKEVIQVFANDAVRSSEVVVESSNSEIHRKSTVSMTAKSVHPPKTLSKKDEGGQGGGRRRDSLTGRRIKICKGNYKGSIGIVSNVKGQSLHVQLQSTGKTVTVNRSEIKEDVDVTVPHRCGTRNTEPSTPSRTPLHPTTTPMRELEATQFYDGMRTPMHSRAWNPYALMTPERTRPPTPARGQVGWYNEPGRLGESSMTRENSSSPPVAVSSW